MTVLDPVDLPERALELKPWFPKRPGPDIVREIKEFVAQIGKPYLWRGHTHTKPPDAAPIVYLGEFDLPKRCKLPFYWSPCPCCSPVYPKYRDNGKIAWFPEEKVIRLIGPDCFKKLNPEGHDAALAVLRAEQQRERDIRYLLSNLPVVPQAVRAVETAMPMAEAVDDLRATLRNRLEVVLKMNLWPVLRDGVLTRRVRRTVPYRNRDGTEGTRTEELDEVYARIEGHRLLDPRLQRFAPRVTTIVERLRAITFEAHEVAIEGMDDDERSKVARTLGSNIERARRTFAELEDVRRFVSTVTVATLRNWSQQDGSALTLFIERIGHDLYVGKRRDERLRIELNPAIDAALPALPEIGATSFDQDRTPS